MQIAKTLPQDRPIQVGVLLFPRFSNHCLSLAVEPLRACNDLTGQHLHDWRYLSPAGGVVRSSSGLEVRTEGALSADPGGDFLFVLPCFDHRTLADAASGRMLRAAQKRFGTIVGMDTGGWLLAAAGLLDGRAATIHWDEWDAMAEAFPRVEVRRERVVHDGNIRTCGGASTTFEMLLDLVEEMHGPALRLELAAYYMHHDMAQYMGQGMPQDMTGEPGRQGAMPPRLRRDRLPEAAVMLMRRHIEAPLSIDEIARRLGLGRRSLEKACRARFGAGPDELYRGVRLREARRLMEETGLPVVEVATRCGYRDASALARAFGQMFGMSPTRARQRRIAQAAGDRAVRVRERQGAIRRNGT